MKGSFRNARPREIQDENPHRIYAVLRETRASNKAKRDSERKAAEGLPALQKLAHLIAALGFAKRHRSARDAAQRRHRFQSRPKLSEYDSLGSSIQIVEKASLLLYPPDLVINSATGPRSRSKPGAASHVRSRNAFTLIELLVIIAIIAILASLLFPAMARAKREALAIQCLGNQKQLTLAWLLFADDHEDVLPPNLGSMYPDHPETNTWVRGWLDNDARIDWHDNTNIFHLKNSLLGPYLDRSVQVWKCPEDQSASRFSIIQPGGKPPFRPTGVRMVPRVRSYSMNGWLNSPERDPASHWRIFRKTAEITRPSPAELFVIFDERE